MCTSKKKKYVSKNSLGLLCYLALCANRNVLKKHISASPTVSFTRTLKTFVHYLKAMINKFTSLISIYGSIL